MTIGNSSIEGMHRAQALLGYAASKVANPATGADVVSLSDAALALIQARIGMSANATAFRAAVEMEKALIDVMA